MESINHMAVHRVPWNKVARKRPSRTEVKRNAGRRPRRSVAVADRPEAVIRVGIVDFRKADIEPGSEWCRAGLTFATS